MTSLARHHAVEGFGAGWRVARRQLRNPTNGRQDKSADRGRAHVVGGVKLFDHCGSLPAGASRQFLNDFNVPSAIASLAQRHPR